MSSKPKENRDGLFEIRVTIEEADLNVLQEGKVLRLGCLSFGEPVVITLQKRRSRSSETTSPPAAPATA